jgi:hypothetical protein
MVFVLVLGFSAGLALGVKYHKQIMSLIATTEARVATWKQGLKKGESEGAPKEDEPKKGESRDMQGEGDRESARRYDEATQAFVESGKVKEHADTTAQISPEEKRELEEAEKAGKERAKEEDPAVQRDYSKPE